MGGRVRLVLLAQDSVAMTLGMSLQASVLPVVMFLQNGNWEACHAYQFSAG